ncbi:MAG: hypothetical protein GXN94_02230 [Aquificae bacterium]|nr:hypothetical protein [Aquificota bacterium]
MKYKVSKEELEALFREIYSSKDTGGRNYASTGLKEAKEYQFLAYKYRSVLKNHLVSSLPIKLRPVSYGAFWGSSTEDKNIYIAGYDVEKKFRVYTTVSEKFDTAVKSGIGMYSLLDLQFNTERFVDSLGEAVVSRLKKDYPYNYKKINTAGLQFYDEEFLKLSYRFEIGGEEVDFCIWLDRGFVETDSVSPFITSPPTSLGRKKLKKLKENLTVNFVVESKPVMVDINKLREGEEISLNPEFVEKVV